MNVGSPISLGRDQRWSQRHENGELFPGTAGRIGERLEYLECFAELANGLDIRRASHGVSPGFDPVFYGFAIDARLGVVIREHFGLADPDLRKLLLQHLSDPVMVLLSCAPQQGLIGGVAYERVLEGVGRMRRQSALIQQLRVHQSSQFTLEGRLVQFRDSSKHCI
jgi:hypothetical protein